MEVYMIYKIVNNKQNTTSTRLFENFDKATKEVKKLNRLLYKKLKNKSQHYCVSIRKYKVE